MNRMSFEPPTEHYDNRIEAIDEKICDLIKQRKEISNNNPGFPTKNLISNWSEKYNFYEAFLYSIFSDLFHEEIYKPIVEPQGFVKNIAILKSFENDGVFYSITFVRQFENASVVHFNIDREDIDEEMHGRYRRFTHFEMSIDSNGTEYESRNVGGGGSGSHETFTFIVSPALPDDISKFKLVFKEYEVPFQKPTGFEFVI